MKVYHRNICNQNIQLDWNNCVKVVNFENAVFEGKSVPVTDELIAHLPVDECSDERLDVFQLGCVLLNWHLKPSERLGKLFTKADIDSALKSIVNRQLAQLLEKSLKVKSFPDFSLVEFRESDWLTDNQLYCFPEVSSDRFKVKS